MDNTVWNGTIRYNASHKGRKEQLTTMQSTTFVVFSNNNEFPLSILTTVETLNHPIRSFLAVQSLGVRSLIMANNQIPKRYIILWRLVILHQYVTAIYTVKASTRFRRRPLRFVAFDCCTRSISSSWGKGLVANLKVQPYSPRPLASPTLDTCTTKNSSMHQWNESNAVWRALSRSISLQVS